MKKQSWEKVLEQFVSTWSKKKEVSAIIISGSYITGNPSKHSDLDVNIILKPDTKWRERGNVIIDGYLIEYFANPPSQIEEYFKKDHGTNRRITAHMYATGRTIIDKDGYAKKVRKQAKSYLRKSYKPMASFAKKTTKYLLWDSLDNLEEIFEAKTPDYDYAYYCHLDKLFNEYAVFVGYSETKPHKVYPFLTNKKTRAKYDMPQFPDKKFVRLWLKCMQEQKKAARQEKVIKLTKHVLDSMGGFVLDGFKFRSKI